jgi:Cu+-exporting ATPase
MAKQRDPVCGMQDETKTAAGSSEYQGETYYFCSAGCKERFDQEPEKYAEKGE